MNLKSQHFKELMLTMKSYKIPLTLKVLCWSQGLRCPWLKQLVKSALQVYLAFFFICLVFQIIGIYEVTEALKTAGVMREFATHVSAGGATACASLQVGKLCEHRIASSGICIV